MDSTSVLSVVDCLALREPLGAAFALRAPLPRLGLAEGLFVAFVRGFFVAFVRGFFVAFVWAFFVAFVRGFAAPRFALVVFLLVAMMVPAGVSPFTNSVPVASPR
jgi:hypothetical protein